MPRAQLPCDLQSRKAINGRRGTEEKTIFFDEKASHGHGLYVGDADGGVDEWEAMGEVGCQSVESDAFDDGVDLGAPAGAFFFGGGEEDAVGYSVVEAGALGIRKDDFDGGRGGGGGLCARFKKSGYAGDGSTCPCPRYKSVETATTLSVDFWSSGGVVCGVICI